MSSLGQAVKQTYEPSNIFGNQRRRWQRPYSSITTTAAEIAKGPVKRSSLIGSGWYGKIDLFRLIQVAPVEVVALCDVDSTMLSEAADMVAKRQKSGKRPKTYADYRTLLRTTLI